MTLLYKDYLKTDLWKENKEKAIKRDDYKCTRCGSAKNLEFHHIKYPNDFQYDSIDNIVTLCAKCHSEIHKKDLHFTALKKIGLTEEEYQNMGVYDYAKILADAIDINDMEFRELESYAKLMTSEITEKFNKEIDTISIINNGNRIVSLEGYAGGLLNIVFAISDLHVSHWMSWWERGGFCPSFKLNTDYIKNELWKKELSLVKSMGLSREEIEEKYIIPYVSSEDMDDYREASYFWWNDFYNKRK